MNSISSIMKLSLGEGKFWVFNDGVFEKKKLEFRRQDSKRYNEYYSQNSKH